ncbi:MAG: hypothetical protein JNK11_10380 [Alphaproteobacteria bacterium]|nr:hypothetical protein [Alphaproteobacteria bacterium]
MGNRNFIGIASSSQPSSVSEDGKSRKGTARGRHLADSMREMDRERREAFLTGLLYLQREARDIGAHLAATLIGAAGEALDPHCTSRALDQETGEDGCKSDGNDKRAGLARCLGLLCEELSSLADPMPARFVNAAIMSLGECGPWEIARMLQSKVSVRVGSRN